ncbi:MAG: sigma-54-dependent Fis family transcriptional regulator [Nitrospirae bacterium]|nr:MAG: sigma-54-dependent Fis family transcriptional regulator [Nitrospirota bacterium]
MASALESEKESSDLAQQPGRILIVEDEADVREALRVQLELAGYEVNEARSGLEALEHIQTISCDVVLTDVQMPGLNGLELLKRLAPMQPAPVTVVMTGYGTVAMGVEAMKAGAHDFLEKPFSPEVLIATIASALRVKRLRDENLELRRTVRGQFGLGKLVSQSEVMKEVLKLVECVADSEGTVLLLGESGTGKELLAQTIHFNSPRRHGPLVPVNCGAIPESLLESELFGHEKGAFTGAVTSRVGRFELATGGTIFLDEIGDLSPPLQVKLLRVLQERTFERVGGTRTLKTDARIIAATNQDLEELVATKRFREDLYYRLNVVPIVVPPLRQRTDDIPLLVEYFIQQLNERRGASLTGCSAEALSLLSSYSWPGNVRELANLIERIAILKRTGLIEPEDLPEKIRRPPMPSSTLTNSLTIPAGGIDLGRAVEEFENRLILEALDRTNGVKSKAAQLLQINRTTLIEKLKRKSLVEALAQRQSQSSFPT